MKQIDRTILTIPRLWLLVVWVSLAGVPLTAQETSETPATDSPAAAAPITRELVTNVQTTVTENAEFSDLIKGQAGELAQQALANLQAAETAKAEALKYSEELNKVADLQKEIQQKLAALKNPTDVKIDPNTAVAQLEAEKNLSQQQITELEHKLTMPSVDPVARATRRKAARTFLIELPAQLQDVTQRLEAPPPAGEPPEISKLRQYALLTRRESLQQRALAAQNELALFDAEDALSMPTLRRELRTGNLARERREVELYTARINQIRQAEAEQRVRDAQQATMRAEPSLEPILKFNEQVALEEANVRREYEAVEQSIREIDQRLKELREDLKNLRELDEQIGLSASAGLQLRKLRSELPNVAGHQAQRKQRYDTLESAHFILYERNDQLEDLEDIAAAADDVVASSGVGDPEKRSRLREDALTALRDQHDYLAKVVTAYRDYTETLTRLDILEEQLIKETRQFNAFVDERILWVRSHRPLGISEIIADWDTFAGVAGIPAWRSIAGVLSSDVRRVPLLYAAAGTLFVFLLVLHRRIGRRLREIAKLAENRVGISLLPTVRAAEYTFLAAITWPGLMGFIAWRLWTAPDPPRIVLAAAVSLGRLAALFFMLELVRQSLRPSGLCESHFGWPGTVTRRIRLRLRQLMLFGLPIAAALALTHFHDADGRQAFIERLFFIAAMLVLVHFAHGLLHPTRGALRDLRRLTAGGWIDRLGIVWYLLGVGLPLLLAAFAATGYYYTAQKLALRSQVTLWLLLGLVYVRAFLLRWLMLRHRRLRLEQLRERQAAQSAPVSDEAGVPLPEPAAEEADLASTSKQSQRLISTTFAVACFAGVWMIWFDVVPAVHFLERWPLWNYETQVMEQETNPFGETEWTPRDVVVPVTIAHLVLAIVILVLTMTAARNLPGLLEITLLNKLPIDRSTAYAITALVRYALVLIGILLASQTLGIGWSKVQWLAAALTFGLGFGLQEIFANFVSGIIILFEQPVRVGDIVTIDGVSGAVNRIRMRATTIVDWDRKEYIVPNKEFITGRLLNWTLSDKMNRIVINIGVAYGSDTDLVRETILEAARSHACTLDDPPPLVTFEEFGDSSLNFVLRAYLPNLDNRLQTIHDLHCDINARLKSAGIVIPFPQRDLHLRTSANLTGNGRETSNGQSNHTSPEAVEVGSD